MYVNDSWNWSTLHTMVPLEVQESVHKIVLHEEVVDTFIWDPSPLGCYSMKSAFRWLCQTLTILNTCEKKLDLDLELETTRKHKKLFMAYL